MKIEKKSTNKFGINIFFQTALVVVINIQKLCMTNRFLLRFYSIISSRNFVNFFFASPQNDLRSTLDSVNCVVELLFWLG